MSIGSAIVDRSVRHHRAVTVAVIAVTVALGLLAGLPSVWPDAAAFLNPVQVDTDPENMLSADEPVRVFHDKMKKTLSLHDIVVVGVVNESDPNGVFNPATLRKVHELSAFSKTLTGEAIGAEEGEGVVEVDLVSLSTVDSIEPSGGAVSFSWLMPTPPETDAEALEVWRKARRVPFLFGTVISDTEPDRPGKAVALYLPLTRKDLSHAVYLKLREKVAALGGPEQFHVTGLPVAEDTFGVEMFVQMAISAPAAMVVIFLLMLAFFRKLVVILAPMIVAMVSVVITMGSLVVAGFPIHIMSSMIPIFIMPIAVLDSIHIISEFFERYQATRDARKTIHTVMDELFTPMLYTSLTSAAGFASLALTPIPPVQVFGIFVAVGIMAAWLLTVTFIPAYVMFIRAETLANFGARHTDGEADHRTAMGRFLRWLAGATFRRAKIILAVAAVILAAAGYGISRININDNPVHWFTRSHPIRRADEVLNRHFGGTYMAYLALEHEPPAFDADAHAAELSARADARAEAIVRATADLAGAAREAATDANDAAAFFDRLKRRLRPDRFGGTDEQLGVWRPIDAFLDLASSDAPEPFDATAYAAALGPRAAAHGRRLADALGSLSEVAKAVAATKPGSRDAMVRAVAEKLRPARAAPEGAGEAPPALDEPGGEPALPPGAEDEPALPTTDSDEPDLPAIGDARPAKKPAEADAYAEAARTERELFVDELRQEAQVFKRPDVLAWMASVQEALKATGTVGKSNSLADVVRTVHRDLLTGTQADYRVPANRATVAQCLEQFGNSHRADDLWHFTTPSFGLSSVWVQLTSGENRHMQQVVEHVDEFVRRNPPPVPIRHRWFGLTYINVEWQGKMVRGMLEAFGGSFLVVLLLMTVLFRSPLWGLLSMVPLTVTIAAIYGAIGLVGKDYDMPVAVLSSLTLGLAIDFAIHFLARSRAMYAAGGSWQKTLPGVFGEPARAIARNIIVIAAGFLPLLLAPLLPYRTVGVLLAIILLVSGVATLLLLPALIRVLEKRLFATGRAATIACNCGVCAVAAVTIALLIVWNLKTYVPQHWTTLTWLAAAGVPVAVAACAISSRREKCNVDTQTQGEDK